VGFVNRLPERPEEREARSFAKNIIERQASESSTADEVSLVCQEALRALDLRGTQ